MQTATLPAEPGWATIWYFDGPDPGLTVWTSPVARWGAKDGRPDITRAIMHNGIRRSNALLQRPDGAIISSVTQARLFADLDALRDDMQAKWRIEQERRRRGRRRLAAEAEPLR